jgi:hypothetical protein
MRASRFRQTIIGQTYDLGRHGVVIEEVLPPIPPPFIPGSSMANAAHPALFCFHLGNQHIGGSHSLGNESYGCVAVDDPWIPSTLARTKSTREWQRSPKAVLAARTPTPAKGLIIKAAF